MSLPSPLAQQALTVLRVALFSSAENPSAHANLNATTMSTVDSNAVPTEQELQMLREEIALQAQVVRPMVDCCWSLGFLQRRETRFMLAASWESFAVWVQASAGVHSAARLPQQ